MRSRTKIIGPIAAALLAGVMIASPAFAQNRHGSHAGRSGSGHSGYAVSGGSGRAGSWQSGHSGRVYGGSRSYAYNGHYGHRHGRGFVGGFGWGGPYYAYGDGAYAYDYDDGYPYEDCYVRVHVHHRWVLRRYCY